MKLRRGRPHPHYLLGLAPPLISPRIVFAGALERGPWLTAILPAPYSTAIETAMSTELEAPGWETLIEPGPYRTDLEGPP